MKKLGHILIMSCTVIICHITVTYGLSGAWSIEVSDSANKRSSRAVVSIGKKKHRKLNRKPKR